MTDNYWQVKAIIDSLTVAEVTKLLDYCKKQFPKAFKKANTNNAESVRAVELALTNVRNGKPFVLKKVMDKIEYDVICRALVRHKKQTRAAHFLGLKEQTLRYKMIRLRIPTVRNNTNFFDTNKNE